MLRSALSVAVVSAVASLCAVPCASAAVRYSAPGAGVAGSCVPVDPCAVQTAIEGAGAGDEVVLAPGTYAAVPAIISTATALHIHGADGQPAPELDLAPAPGMPAIQVTNGLSHVGHLRLENGGTSTALSVRTGSLLEDLTVHATKAGAGGLFILSAGTLRSTIRDVAVNVPGIGLDLWETNADVRNATLRAGRAIDVYNTIAVRDITVRNTILMGSLYDADVDSTAGLVLDIDHSRFAHGHQSDPSATITDGPHDIALPALFADAAGHEAAGSPTIDTGSSDALTRPADLEGTVRPLGAGTDIGAYEFRTPALVATGTADALTAGAAALHGTIDARGESVSWHFAYGPDAGYGSVTPATALGTAGGQQPVTASAGTAGGLPALAPATTYHFRLETTDAYGTTVDGADQTFTTPPVSATPPGTGTPPSGNPPPQGNPPAHVPPRHAARCVVPALRGRTLAAAKTRLRRAHCAVGTIRRRGHGRLVVRTQSVRPGAYRRSGSRVSVVLAPRRH